MSNNERIDESMPEPQRNSPEMPIEIFAALQAVFEDVTTRAEQGVRAPGVSTSFQNVDATIVGFVPGDLVVVAGRPAMGKTSFVLNLATNLASPKVLKEATSSPAEPSVPGSGVLLFTPTKTRNHIAARLACSEGRVEFARFQRGLLLPEEWRRVTESASYVSSLPIWLDDTPNLDIEAIRRKLDAMRANVKMADTKQSADVIIIDHLQFMRGHDGAQNREEQLSEISRQLKILAREHNVVIIAVSTLNRAFEQRQTRDRRPMLSDLRGSGSIEDDADIVILLYRAVVDDTATDWPSRAELIIAKNSAGPRRRVFLRFEETYMRFDNPAASTKDDEDE